MSQIRIVLDLTGEYHKYRGLKVLDYSEHPNTFNQHKTTGELMPTDLVFLGGILTVAGGYLMFVFIRRHKPTATLHIR
jgi:hypothetical protein